MAKDYAIGFYNSSAWKKTAAAFKASKFYLCEKCGAAGYIVHHKKHITPTNINDLNITLNTDNLMLLCIPCHNAIHGRQTRKAVFNENGDMIGIKEK